MNENIVIRSATAADALAAAEVFLASRKQFLHYAPLAHDDDDVRQHWADHLIPHTDVRVALIDTKIVGVLSLLCEDGIGWIEQLYLHPDAVGYGIGTQLLALAKATLGSPIRLYTFQVNTGARRFYERHGFTAIAFGDGSENEEHTPDVLYEWVED